MFTVEEFEKLKEHARLGQAQAEFELGVMLMSGRYIDGVFVSPDRSLGCVYIERSAEKGFLPARSFIDDLQRRERRKKSDLKKARNRNLFEDIKFYFLIAALLVLKIIFVVSVFDEIWILLSSMISR